MKKILVALREFLPFHSLGIVGSYDQIVVKVGPIAVRIFKSIRVSRGLRRSVRSRESTSLQMIGFKFAHADRVGGKSPGFSFNAHAAKHLFMRGTKNVGFDGRIFSLKAGGQR